VDMSHYLWALLKIGCQNETLPRPHWPPTRSPKSNSRNSLVLRTMSNVGSQKPIVSTMWRQRMSRPWKEIKETVVAATKDRNEVLFGKQRPYIKSKYIVEWVSERKEQYKIFEDATPSQIKVWIQHAIHQMGWETWGDTTHNSRSVTYIVPWVEA